MATFRLENFCMLCFSLLKVGHVCVIIFDRIDKYTYYENRLESIVEKYVLVINSLRLVKNMSHKEIIEFEF